MKKLFLSLLGIGISFSLLSQIKGRVIELDAKKNPVGLPNAIIQVKRGEIAMTDTAGYFQLIHATKGDTVLFSLTGYKTEGV
ncbi:MAG TPA: hypothetical protein PK492_10020, partial [Chitinophagaceae bacterium]|nr:hypothetical protein [Chitinophagaceae bacterium]